MQDFFDYPRGGEVTALLGAHEDRRGRRSRWWHPSVPSLRVIYLAAEQELSGDEAGDREAGGVPQWSTVVKPVGHIRRPTLTVS